ncbi:F0F1 ATP synthase subunit B family protein [Denitromonas halophila]|uniref:ATP synthase subunit b n=1 Tax=Denitromonas halophila TaxID=1629404 RepID=A0A557QXZ0_9RHOO|nr:F0F1 ATP synthase subunit B [Denitromonas halophila]TVO57780.1 F0F1 ATP synthase subunit B [Denitromonas halophila]
MLIDWFTVVAQLLNFLILVWLLKRFLYQPVLDAIDAREQRIAKELAQADATRDAAQAEQTHFREQQAALDAQREALLATATAEADAEGKRLIEAARQRATELEAHQTQRLATQATALRQALAERTQHEVFAVCRKALGDLADAGLESRMVATFVRRLQAARAADEATLLADFKASAAPLVVRSAFALSDADRAAVQAALKDDLGIAQAPQFEIASDRVAGIEIASAGQTLGWSIADYLDALQASVSELLAAPAPPAGEAKPSIKLKVPTDAG